MGVYLHNGCTMPTRMSVRILMRQAAGFAFEVGCWEYCGSNWMWFCGFGVSGNAAPQRDRSEILIKSSALSKPTFLTENEQSLAKRECNLDSALTCR